MAYQLAFIEGNYLPGEEGVELSLIIMEKPHAILQRMCESDFLAHVMMLDASMDYIVGNLFRRVGETKSFVGKMKYGFCSFDIKCTGEYELTVMSFNKNATSDDYLDAINEGLNLIKYEDAIEA